MPYCAIRSAGRMPYFFEAVSNTIVFVEDQPEIGAVTGVTGKARRVLVNRFPYQVVYHLTPTDVIIVAVAHLKRRPNYWKDRH